MGGEACTAARGRSQRGTGGVGHHREIEATFFGSGCEQNGKRKGRVARGIGVVAVKLTASVFSFRSLSIHFKFYFILTFQNVHNFYDSSKLIDL
jgi:hypothetical protein